MRRIPANLPDDALEPMTSTVKTGIYFGFAQVHPECPNGCASDLSSDELQVWPMVMSIGWNPFYKNEKLTAVRIVFIRDYVLD
jgi:riboflavin kinase